MTEFFRTLLHPDMPFLRYAFIAGLLGSAAFGVIGAYVTVKRISSMAGAIAHSVLAGVGASLYFSQKFGIEWLTPTVGATIAALLAAFLIGIAGIYAKEREDTIIGAIWAVGMAVGILFIARTPGYVDPMSYLFGNILIVTRRDLFVIAMLDIVVVAMGLVFYRQLEAVAFDEEFSRVRGIPVHVYYFLLLVLSALTIVILAQVVGVIMVIALLTIPPAVAGLFARTLAAMMGLGVLFAALFTSAGMMVSYVVDMPSGSIIIVIAAAFYLLAVTARAIAGKKLRSKPGVTS